LEPYRPPDFIPPTLTTEEIYILKRFASVIKGLSEPELSEIPRMAAGTKLARAFFLFTGKIALWLAAMGSGWAFLRGAFPKWFGPH
jgi:hypothetical protein